MMQEHSRFPASLFSGNRISTAIHSADVQMGDLTSVSAAGGLALGSLLGTVGGDRRRSRTLTARASVDPPSPNYRYSHLHLSAILGCPLSRPRDLASLLSPITCPPSRPSVLVSCSRLDIPICASGSRSSSFPMRMTSTRSPLASPQLNRR